MTPRLLSILRRVALGVPLGVALTLATLVSLVASRARPA